jgi:hypothetical protein
MNYHIGRLVLSSLCVGDLMRLVFGGVRFAGFSLKNENHQKPAAPKAQHVSDINISITRSLRLW